MFIRSLIAAALVAAPAAALACVNAVRLSNDKIVGQIDVATKKLADGDYPGAIIAVRQGFPRGVKGAPSEAKQFPAVLKAQATVAIAVVRSGDLVPVDGNAFARARNAKGAPVKAGDLAWATERLTKWQARNPDDPARKAWLAEAQAASGQTAAARATLEALAKADLLSDAASWGVLAALRGQAGDAAGAKAAMTRCRATAGKPIVCGADPGLGGS